ncbi:Rv3235 family protein [Cellulomonas fengjieae]|uniref:Rv3235 family protein n=1 Tax=Cellulomonas fengjieae TaxID=2819978 RepID=UPI001AAE5B2F|nr:Rv3235 family protein [Cellulomonas fengjieae]MBO3101356.1 energy transducer TonB [Cellulomonas fengjieae]
MSALTLPRGVTPAEDAFARVRGTVGQHGPTPARPGAHTHGPARARPPQVRLVPAVAAAVVEEATGPAHAAPATAADRIAVLRASDRSVVTDADDDAPRTLPEGDPAVVARAVALAALEVLSGRRSVAQLARWLTPGVYEPLQVRAGLTQRVVGTPAGTRPPVVRRSRACRVEAHVVEATVVADDGVRVRAVALRLEGHRGAWRVTALEIG